MRIYLASSWKNKAAVDQVAKQLESHDHEVDNFTDQSKGRFVFSWTELSPKQLQNLNAQTFLNDWRAQKAFQQDREKIEWADALLLVMPCGRSAHLEAGYAAGLGKKVMIYYPAGFVLGEFETMYGFASLVTDSIYDIICQLPCPKGHGLYLRKKS